MLLRVVVCVAIVIGRVYPERERGSAKSEWTADVDDITNMFNKPDICLLFATLTNYAKAEVLTVDDEVARCRLVEPMYDPRQGIMYETGEVFTVVVDPPVEHELCPYDHGLALLKIHAGQGAGGEWPSSGYVVATVGYGTKTGGLVPMRLVDIPAVVSILERYVVECASERQLLMKGVSHRKMRGKM